MQRAELSVLLATVAAAHKLHVAAIWRRVTVSNSLLLLCYACIMRVWLLVVVVLVVIA